MIWESYKEDVPLKRQNKREPKNHKVEDMLLLYVCIKLGDPVIACTLYVTHIGYHLSVCGVKT